MHAIRHRVIIGDISLFNMTIQPISTSVRAELKELSLKVYPSPFKDKLYFDLQLKQDADVRLEMYNILGSKLQTIFIGYVQGE